MNQNAHISKRTHLAKHTQKEAAAKPEQIKAGNAERNQKKREKLEAPAIAHNGRIIGKPGKAKGKKDQDIESFQGIEECMFHNSTSWVYFTITAGECN
jgi:hypothetical protein